MKTMQFIAGVFLSTLLILPLSAGATPKPNELTFAQVEKIVLERKIRNVEDFLAALPKEFRSSFVLMYESKSLQGATVKAPRVIFYGKSASLMMTFNGDSTQKGYNDIEIIEAKDGGKRFELREITFDGKGGHISPPNPEKCIKCHGADSKPIWDNYPFWPGAYTGDDDGRSGEMFPGERKELDAFIETAGLHPRYKHLEKPKKAYEIAEKLGKGDGSLAYRLKNPPNHTLSVRLNLLHFNRMARLIRELSGFKAYRWAMAGSLYCKDDEDFRMDSFFPLNFKFSQNNSLKDVVNPQYLENRRGYGEASRLRFVLAEMGMKDTEELLTVLRPTLESSLGGTSSDSGEFMPYIAGDDSELLDFFMEHPKEYTYITIRRLKINGDRMATCEDFRKRSVAAIKAYQSGQIRAVPCVDQSKTAPDSNMKKDGLEPVTSQLKQFLMPPASLMACMRCHEASGPGPAIPFNKPELLSEELKNIRGSQGKTFREEIEFRVTTDEHELAMPPGSAEARMPLDPINPDPGHKQLMKQEQETAREISDYLRSL